MKAVIIIIVILKVVILSSPEILSTIFRCWHISYIRYDPLNKTNCKKEISVDNDTDDDGYDDGDAFCGIFLCTQHYTVTKWIKTLIMSSEYKYKECRELINKKELIQLIQ